MDYRSRLSVLCLVCGTLCIFVAVGYFLLILLALVFGGSRDAGSWSIYALEILAVGIGLSVLGMLVGLRTRDEQEKKAG